MDKKNKYIDMLNSDNFATQLNSLPPEEKVNIIYSNDYISELIMRKCELNGVNLFNQEELIKLWKNSEEGNYFKFFLDSNIRNNLLMDICNFPDEILKERYYSSKEVLFLQYIKNDDIIIDIINNSLEEYNISNLISLLSEKRNIDKIIENLLNNPRFNYMYEDLLWYIKDEDKLIQYLEKIPKRDRADYISTIKDDEIKKQMLKSLKIGRGKIIASLSNVEDKEHYLKKIKRQFYFHKSEKNIDIINILASINDINYLKKYINYLNNDWSKYEFLNQASASKEKLPLFEDLILSINNNQYITELLKKCHVWYENLNIDVNITLIDKLIDKINNQKLLIECYKIFDDFKDIQNLIIKRLNKNSINSIVTNDLENFSNYNIFKYIEDDSLFFDAIGHYNFYDNYSDDMLPIFKRFATKYNLNLNHLIKLAQIGNFNILRDFNNNIMKAINLDEESFEKYIKIFEEKNRKMDKSTLFIILNSTLQKNFSLCNQNLINIFANTLQDIDLNNIEAAKMKTNIVCSSLKINNYGISKKELIDGLIKKDNKIINIYNKMTNDYLKKIRNLYVENNMDHVLELVTHACYEKNSLINYLMKVTPVDIILFNLKELRSHKNSKYFEAITKLSSSEMELLENDELLQKIIEFKKNITNQKDIDVSVKQNLKNFNNLYYGYVEYNNSHYLNQPIIKEVKKAYNLYKDNKLNKSFHVDLMSNIDIDKIKNTVFNNEELYKELLKYLSKYKIIALKDIYSPAFTIADIELDPTLIASLISNFELIMKTKMKERNKGNNFNFINELDLANVLNSDANIYSYLLGKEDYKFIKTNPGPNSSSMNKKERLNETIYLLKKMHERKYITVPPIDETIKLKNNKEINICLGNTSSMKNLTYGERTGSCMRIGGFGNSLFNYCLLNENGFHISFNDPTTGKLISRISGFRNDNTVFLNQLRYSLVPNYNDNDLIEACEAIGEKIIEKSKDSKYPIVNVVASNGYAFKKSSVTDLDIQNCKKGLPNFYCDINNKNVIVVATANNGDLLPIKLGQNQVEKYSVSREKPKKYKGIDAADSMIHIEVLDKYYSGIDITDIEVEEKDNVLTSYIGEDWYIAILEDYTIINYIQKNSRDIDTAKKEMNKYLNIIKKEINEIKKENEKYNNKNTDTHIEKGIINEEIRVMRR
ncbi:MAG: hypothetical protein IKF19_06600 [Bacilli bacterium]|nr:hypothetical protein [Bacilli bacterium]